jgi:CubicO group peptidase (beta-lactamase class C family)
VGAAGRLSRSPRSAAVTPDTVYDLASVTKPFVAVTVVRLAQSGAFALDAPLGHYLSEARGTPVEAATVELLLAHRAGLDAHRPLYRPLELRRSFERSPALERACRARRRCGGIPSEGFSAVYSDLGYLLIGEALGRHAQRALDSLVSEQVSRPLGLDAGSARQWLGRDPSFALRVAPTETIAWRGGQIAGMVHDENAWAIAGAGWQDRPDCSAPRPRWPSSTCAADASGGIARNWLTVTDLDLLLRERPGGSLRPA